MIWEQRWHPLREEWVILAAHRQDRPWRGEVVVPPTAAAPPHDPACPFCPGNVRSGGTRNPPYPSTFVFDNDWPCVGPDAPRPSASATLPYAVRPARGCARVLCYTPRHDLSLAQLGVDGTAACLRALRDQHVLLASRQDTEGILIFENRGASVGVSNPHPHCQIYATNPAFPNFVRQAAASRRYHQTTGRALFQDLLAAERQDGRRILFENAGAIAFVPYCARWAYEVWVAPCASHPDLGELDDAELDAFAEALSHTLVKLDNLWRMPFPYVMVFHQAPLGVDRGSFHFHVEIHPPLRKPDLLKYLAGPEVGGGGFVSDTCPEDKAAELRAVTGPYYSQHTP